MKKALLIVFLVGILTACAPAVMPTSTETIHPTITLLSTPVPTATLIPVTETPSLVPTDPISPMITRDPIQVERWKEYQTELAKSILFNLPPDIVLCEWQIMGQSNQDVYVWAVCAGGGSSGSVPTVIHLGAGGTIQSVEVPGPGTYDYDRMFPTYIQEKFEFYNFGEAKKMSDHLEWRQEHPDEPPLIVFLATPTP